MIVYFKKTEVTQILLLANNFHHFLRKFFLLILFFSFGRKILIN